MSVFDAIEQTAKVQRRYQNTTKENKQSNEQMKSQCGVVTCANKYGKIRMPLVVVIIMFAREHFTSDEMITKETNKQQPCTL